jgi:hypothetical protein
MQVAKIAEHNIHLRCLAAVRRGQNMRGLLVIHVAIKCGYLATAALVLQVVRGAEAKANNCSCRSSARWVNWVVLLLDEEP